MYYFLLIQKANFMKKVLLTLAVIGLISVACNNKKTDEHGHDHGTHVHEDGSVHENHEEEVTTAQEEFTVSSDSTATDAHEHQHENGEAHQH